MLIALWLEMAAHDVYMQPMGSMLTNPKYAAAIARRFGVDDCWLVLRLRLQRRAAARAAARDLIV